MTDPFDCSVKIRWSTHARKQAIASTCNYARPVFASPGPLLGRHKGHLSRKRRGQERRDGASSALNCGTIPEQPRGILSATVPTQMTAAKKRWDRVQFADPFSSIGSTGREQDTCYSRQVWAWTHAFHGGFLPPSAHPLHARVVKSSRLPCICCMSHRFRFLCFVKRFDTAVSRPQYTTAFNAVGHERRNGRHVQRVAPTILTSAASESFSAASPTLTTSLPTRKSCTNLRQSPPRLFSCTKRAQKEPKEEGERATRK